MPATTGALPPPRPAGPGWRYAPGSKTVDWRAVLVSAGWVALIGAVLACLRVVFPAVAILSVFWTISCAGTALGLYARFRSGAWLDARTGMRIGVVAALLMVAAAAIARSATGVAMRFGTHSMAATDAEEAAQRKVAEAQVTQWTQLESQPKEVQEKFHEVWSAPEAIAGSFVAGLGMLGGIILVFSAGLGAFVGMLRGSQAARQGLRPGE